MSQAVGVGRRALAWLVDFALVLAIATLLVIVTMHRIGLLLTNVPGLAGQSAWQLVKSHGHLVGAAEGLGRSLWHSALSDVQQGLGALVLLTFAYQFGALALSGRTLGKALLRLRVGGRHEPWVPGPVRQALGGRRAAIRGAVTTVADIGCFALACSLLVGGSFLLAAVCWALAVALFWANAVPALVGTRRSLADRLAGTGVRRAPVAGATGADAQVGSGGPWVSPVAAGRR
ncbi:RDD family protein [Kitasatospora sp. NPDC008050]|uniref:RDD family protein n=1 Tax=Kitasatospora sp. NPDC008050 TaxID=3364021 RepID=UPI0036E12D77